MKPDTPVQMPRPWLVPIIVAVTALVYFTWWSFPRDIPIWDYRIVAQYPHDPKAYTQGLLFADGFLYESTGLYGKSSVRRIDPATGTVLERTELPGSLYGEGLVLQGDRLVQLTWKSGEARVYDRATLTYQESLDYEGQGWGLSFDGTHFIRSDGTDRLYFHAPDTFAEVHSIRVHEGRKRIGKLNELEFVDGEIFANIWKSKRIARIDPRTGELMGWIDLRGLYDTRHIRNKNAVLNGIAWDSNAKRLFVTGKLWPVIFEIELEQRSRQ